MSDIQKRIITHMNKDHQLALVDYVVVYGGRPVLLFRPESVHITTVSETEMVLSFVAADNTDESLTIVWSDAKEDENFEVAKLGDLKDKLVAMAKYAARQRGLSHVQITTYTPPSTAISYAMYGTAIALGLAMVRRTWLRDLVVACGGEIPALVNPALSFLERHAKSLTIGMYGIHVLESVFVVRPKVKKYRIPSQTAWAWYGMNFIEGFLVFSRIEKLARH